MANNVLLDSFAMEVAFSSGNGVTAHNYEIGALAAIVLMVASAGYTAPNSRKQAVFLGSAVYGLAVALTYLRREENNFIRTLVGSLIDSAVAVTILVALPRKFRTLKGFWAIDHTPGG